MSKKSIEESLYISGIDPYEIKDSPGISKGAFKVIIDKEWYNNKKILEDTINDITFASEEHREAYRNCFNNK